MFSLERWSLCTRGSQYNIRGVNDATALCSIKHWDWCTYAIGEAPFFSNQKAFATLIWDETMSMVCCQSWWFYRTRFSVHNRIDKLLAEGHLVLNVAVMCYRYKTVVHGLFLVVHSKCKRLGSGAVSKTVYYWHGDTLVLTPSNASVKPNCLSCLSFLVFQNALRIFRHN